MLARIEFPPTPSHGTVRYNCSSCGSDILRGDDVMHQDLGRDFDFWCRDVFTHWKCMYNALASDRVDAQQTSVSVEFNRLRDEIIARGTLFAHD